MDRKSRLRTPGDGSARTEAADELLVCGALRVDLADKRVGIDGTPVPLPPKVYELLVLLLSEPRRVHTREALFEILWPQSVLLDANLTTTVSQLRKALTETLREHLRTVPRVGYSWDADVRRLPRETGVDGAASSTSSSTFTSAPAHEVDVVDRNPRRWRWAAFAAGLALVAIATVSAIRWSSADKPRPALLLARPVMVDRDDGRDWMSRIVADALEHHLQLSPRVRVLTAGDSVGMVAAHRELGAADGADHLLRVELATKAAGATELRAVLTDAGGDSHRLRVQVGEGGLVMASQSLARQVLQKLVGESPELQLRSIAPAAYVAYEAGMRAESRGRAEEARRFYEEAIARSPGFASARVRLADLLSGQGLVDLAAAQWQAAAASPELGPEARGRAQADALLLAGKPLAAAAILQELSERFPDEPRHRLGWIESLIRARGDSLAEAEQALRKWKQEPMPKSLTVRTMLLEARLRNEQGRADEEFEAYRRLAEVAVKTGMPLIAADAQLHVGLIHRNRGENEAAGRAFAASVRSFREAGAEAHAKAAELNLLLLPPLDSDSDALRNRAEALAAFAARALSDGHGQHAAQALDASAADWLSLGDLERGRSLAEQAEVLMQRADPSLRAGPQITLALVDLRSGRPRSALRRLDGLALAPGKSADIDAELLTIRAWIDLGQPRRAQTVLDAALRRWGPLPAASSARRRIACQQATLALLQREAERARTAIQVCTAVDSPDRVVAAAELAVLEGDARAVKTADTAWFGMLGRIQKGPPRIASEIALSRYRLEHGDDIGARLLQEGIDHDAVPALPPATLARYWLNAATIAAIAGNRAGFRDALARADRAIGPELLALRREYRLLRLSDGGPGNRDALAALGREAEAAGALSFAERVHRLETHWQQSPKDAWADTDWWRHDQALR
jgi:cellulose synthase operon protein C